MDSGRNKAGGWALFAVLVFALLADGIMEAWGPAGFVVAAGVTAAAVAGLLGHHKKGGKDHERNRNPQN